MLEIDKHKRINKYAITPKSTEEDETEFQTAIAIIQDFTEGESAIRTRTSLLHDLGLLVAFNKRILGLEDE